MDLPKGSEIFLKFFDIFCEESISDNVLVTDKRSWIAVCLDARIQADW